MIYWTNYKKHEYEIIGRKERYESTVFVLDIETSSYLILNDKQISASDYLKLDEKERKESLYNACMYIWMLSINDIVYYGRTYKELEMFFTLLENNCNKNKIIFVHNLSYEFQFLKGYFKFDEVMSRKSRKVMKCKLSDFNIEFRCSLMMSNVKLKELPIMYKLPVEKMVGDLDYNLIRTPITPLDEKELKYCENDCLVVYYYILYELETYKTVKSIPITSTGHVRRELKEITQRDYFYKKRVSKAVNVNPHIYNLLVQSFMGGYTHANWIYTDEIIKHVDSFDFTSSYPYVMCTHKYPSNEFLKCRITRIEQMSDRFAYLIVVKFYNLKCKYFNNFISQSKGRNIKGAKYDNGRIIECEEIELTLTDIDFKFILESYKCKYEILECYYSAYNYLPKKFINFILDKYVLKTKYKGIEDKELEYQKQKGLFNSLYGCSVTNTIRDRVEYDNIKGWIETPLENEEIIEKLLEEKDKGFLSFAYGVWVTAWARFNLLSNVIKLDEYVVYCDTDSIKLLPGYNKKIIDDYNNKVINKIKKVSENLDIDINKFAPEDIKGKKRILGVFDDDGHYEEFITQGAKKYAVKIKVDKNKIDNIEEYKEKNNVVDEDDNYLYVIKITVAGVPKNGSKGLQSLDDFRDDFVFDYEYTNKNLLIYNDNQEEYTLTDYLGKTYTVTDKSGACIVPTTYVLSKSLEYANLLNENSSNRAIYKE